MRPWRHPRNKTDHRHIAHGTELWFQCHQNFDHPTNHNGNSWGSKGLKLARNLGSHGPAALQRSLAVLPSHQLAWSSDAPPWVRNRTAAIAQVVLPYHTSCYKWAEGLSNGHVGRKLTNSWCGGCVYVDSMPALAQVHQHITGTAYSGSRSPFEGCPVLGMPDLISCR